MKQWRTRKDFRQTNAPQFVVNFSLLWKSISFLSALTPTTAECYFPRGDISLHLLKEERNDLLGLLFCVFLLAKIYTFVQNYRSLSFRWKKVVDHVSYLRIERYIRQNDENKLFLLSSSGKIASAATMPLFIALWTPFSLATFIRPAVQPIRQPPGKATLGTVW